MSQPVTAKFGKMRVLLGKYPDTVVDVTSVTNANPAVVAVGIGDIGEFKQGNEVTIEGVTGTGMTAANGRHTIGPVNSSAGTFVLVGVDTSAGAAPATTGITAAVKDKTGAITYAAPCGFTSKNCTISKNLAEVSIPDCEDPDAPIWIGRDVQSQSCTISGDGVAAAESVPDWDEAAMTTESIPMMVEIEFENVGTKRISGDFHLDSEAFAAEQGGRVTLSINAQSDGQVTAVWVPV